MTYHSKSNRPYSRRYRNRLTLLSRLDSVPEKPRQSSKPDFLSVLASVIKHEHTGAALRTTLMAEYMCTLTAPLHTLALPSGEPQKIEKPVNPVAIRAKERGVLLPDYTFVTAA